MRKYYPGLTLLKFVGAVMVVLTHIKEFPLNDELNSYIPGFSLLCAIVVPAFYVMAGFLACNGWMMAPDPGRYIRSYVGWISRVYGLFCLLLFFTDPLSVVRSGTFAHRSLKYYVEPFLVLGPYVQLWFIPPMLVAMVLGYWAERRGQLALLGGFTLLGYLVAASILGPLHGLSQHVLGTASWDTYRHWGLLKALIQNHLINGLPYVFAGICIAKWETGFVQLNKWRLLVPTLLWSALELVLIRRQYPTGYPFSMLFAHLPLTLVLFYGLLQVNSPWVKPYHKYLRRLSMFLFFVHWPLIVFNRWLLGSTEPVISPTHTALCIGLTFAQILLLERLASWLQRKRKPTRVLTANA
ncbi:hypothetical protein GCM10027346_38820 [Hymenobacter seoulensis]